MIIIPSQTIICNEEIEIPEEMHVVPQCLVRPLKTQVKKKKFLKKCYTWCHDI